MHKSLVRLSHLCLFRKKNETVSVKAKIISYPNRRIPVFLKRLSCSLACSCMLYTSSRHSDWKEEPMRPQTCASYNDNNLSYIFWFAVFNWCSRWCIDYCRNIKIKLIWPNLCVIFVVGLLSQAFRLCVCALATERVWVRDSLYTCEWTDGSESIGSIRSRTILLREYCRADNNQKRIPSSRFITDWLSHSRSHQCVSFLFYGNDRRVIWLILHWLFYIGGVIQGLVFEYSVLIKTLSDSQSAIYCHVLEIHVKVRLKEHTARKSAELTIRIDAIAVNNRTTIGRMKIKVIKWEQSAYCEILFIDRRRTVQVHIH